MFWKLPLRPNRISGYQALKRQAALPITMDEGLVSPVEVEEFIRLGMIDGVTIKPSRAGGLASARRQIEIALDAGVFFLGSGLTDPDIALAASLALFGSYGLARSGSPERSAVSHGGYPRGTASHFPRHSARAHRAGTGHPSGRTQGTAIADDNYL